VIKSERVCFYYGTDKPFLFQSTYTSLYGSVVSFEFFYNFSDGQHDKVLTFKVSGDIHEMLVDVIGKIIHEVSHFYLHSVLSVLFFSGLQLQFILADICLCNS
tara:strand:- start:115 stop:423 length:309 start_codon:yes stop_codon:yes gene_type:complete